jgi:hypothetical protein
VEEKFNMPNNSAVIFGRVTDKANGRPVADCDISHNFVFCDGAVSVGGDDDLKKFVPNVKTNQDGRFALPFFWSSTNGNVLGSSPVTASVLAIKFDDRGSYRSLNVRGRMFLTLDIRKLIGAGYPTLPGSAPELANIGKDFYASYRDILASQKAFPQIMPFSTEVQGLIGNIDVALP